tara:strand:- start:569 stop:1147 length:579 start_codon:yes stop_codon:yes gene_type:complete
VNEEDKSKKISDMELSLISAISGLDNKLEELDHNLALISKSGIQFSNSNISENDINKKIQNFEEKLISLDKKISEKILISKNDKYINTIPSKSKIGPVRKGYALAENLRLKRIDSLEQQLSDLAIQFNEKFPASKNNNEIKVSSIEENTKSEIVITEDFVYERSKGMFFAFLFSIAIIFLLIIVSTGTNIFI